MRLEEEDGMGKSVWRGKTSLKFLSVSNLGEQAA
jgi:hypothetical protein